MIASNEKDVVYERVGKSRFRILFWWARALVTAGLAWYLISQMRGELNHLKLQLVSPWHLFLAFCSAIVALFCSVWVWQMMLSTADRPGYLTLLAHYLLGFFYNNFLPGGLGGDVVRTGALVQGGQQLVPAANSVLMARIAGLWSMILLACLAAPLYALETSWQVAVPLIFGALGVLAAAALGSVLLFGTPLTFLVKRLPKRWRIWHSELRAYREQPRSLLQALVISFFIQILAVSVNAFTAQALGLSVSFGILLLTIPLVNLIVLLPISIGGFGVREGAYFYLLSSFGVGAGEAVLLSLAVYLLLVLIGAVGAAASQFWIPKTGR